MNKVSFIIKKNVMGNSYDILVTFKVIVKHIVYASTPIHSKCFKKALFLTSLYKQTFLDFNIAILFPN